MIVDYLKKDISHIDRIPQVIRQMPGFYEFIKNICNYVDESTESLYKVLEQIQAIVSTDYNKNTNLNYLKRLIDKCGINLKFLSQNLDEETLRNIYITALQGFSVQRFSDSSKENLYEILLKLYPPSGINIEDNDSGINIEDNGADSTSVNKNEHMSYNVYIKNFVQPIENSFLSYYIKPYITGVESTFTFEQTGFLSSMDIIKKDNNFVEDNSLDPNNISEDDKKQAYIDKTKLLQYRQLWMNIDKDSKNEVIFTASDLLSTSEEDVKFTGYWIQEII